LVINLLLLLFHTTIHPSIPSSLKISTYRQKLPLISKTNARDIVASTLPSMRCFIPRKRERCVTGAWSRTIDRQIADSHNHAWSTDRRATKSTRACGKSLFHLLWLKANRIDMLFCSFFLTRAARRVSVAELQIGYQVNCGTRDSHV